MLLPSPTHRRAVAKITAVTAADTASSSRLPTAVGTDGNLMQTCIVPRSQCLRRKPIAVVWVWAYLHTP